MKLIFREWPSVPAYFTIWAIPILRQTDCLGSVNFNVKYTYPWHFNPCFDALSEKDQEEVKQQVAAFVDDWRVLRTVTERITS